MLNWRESMVMEENRREEKKWILLLSVNYGSEVKHVSFEEDRRHGTGRLGSTAQHVR